MQKDIYRDLVRMMFPSSLLDSFDVVGIDESGEGDDKTAVFKFEEKDEYKQAESGHEYEKNGFYESTTITDFPLRDRKVRLEIKRRRWIDRTTGKSVATRMSLQHPGRGTLLSLPIF